MRASKRSRNIKLVRNSPTPAGIEAGAALARLYQRSRAQAAILAPEALAAVGEPCKTCAFIEGTVPNGCPETVLDAIKCVVEGQPFGCHQTFDADGNPQKLCAGWIVTQRADRPPGKVPWKFTALPKSVQRKHGNG